MGMIARRLLRGAVLLVAGAVFSLVGFLIGQELRGSPAALLALAVGLVGIGGVWWWIKRQR